MTYHLKSLASLTVLLAALTFANGEAQAQWVITDLSNPNVITFDISVGWDGQTAETNVNAPNSTMDGDGNDVLKSERAPSVAGQNIDFFVMMERDSGNWVYGNPNNINDIGLSAQAWALYLNGSSDPFDNFDGGDFAGTTKVGRFQMADKSPIDSSDTWGAQVAVNQGGNTGGTLRILNDTGVTQTNLEFELDAWWAQLDPDDFDHTGALSLSYSLDNSSFTEFYNSGLFTTDGSVNNGTQPWTSLGTVGGSLSASWDDGDYLYIRAEQTESGARVIDVFSDNWTLKVVPEPSTPLLLLAGFFGLTMVTRRRRS